MSEDGVMRLHRNRRACSTDSAGKTARPTDCTAIALGVSMEVCLQGMVQTGIAFLQGGDCWQCRERWRRRVQGQFGGDENLMMLAAFHQRREYCAIEHMGPHGALRCLSGVQARAAEINSALYGAVMGYAVRHARNPLWNHQLPAFGSTSK